MGFPAISLHTNANPGPQSLYCISQIIQSREVSTLQLTPTTTTDDGTEQERVWLWLLWSNRQRKRYSQRGSPFFNGNVSAFIITLVRLFRRVSFPLAIDAAGMQSVCSSRPAFVRGGRAHKSRNNELAAPITALVIIPFGARNAIH